MDASIEHWLKPGWVVGLLRAGTEVWMGSVYVPTMRAAAAESWKELGGIYAFAVDLPEDEGERAGGVVAQYLLDTIARQGVEKAPEAPIVSVMVVDKQAESLYLVALQMPLLNHPPGGAD